MTFTKIAVISAFAAIVAAPALAQHEQHQAGPPTPMTPEQRAAAFDKADANKDNKLDFAEWKTTLPAMAAQATDEQLQGFFARRDDDGNKSISKAEFTAPMKMQHQ